MPLAWPLKFTAGISTVRSCCLDMWGWSLSAVIMTYYWSTPAWSLQCYSVITSVDTVSSHIYAQLGMAQNPPFGPKFIFKSVITQCKSCLRITPTHFRPDLAGNALRYMCEDTVYYKHSMLRITCFQSLVIFVNQHGLYSKLLLLTLCVCVGGGGRTGLMPHVGTCLTRSVIQWNCVCLWCSFVH